MTKIFKEGDRVCLTVDIAELWHIGTGTGPQRFTGESETDFTKPIYVTLDWQDGDYSIGNKRQSNNCGVVNRACLAHWEAAPSKPREPDLPRKWAVQCDTFDQLQAVSEVLNVHDIDWLSDGIRESTFDGYKNFCVRIQNHRTSEFLVYQCAAHFRERGVEVVSYDEAVHRMVPGAGRGIRERVRETAFMHQVKVIDVPEVCGHHRMRVIEYGKAAGLVCCLTPGCDQHYKLVESSPLTWHSGTFISGPCRSVAKELWGEKVADGIIDRFIEKGQITFVWETDPTLRVYLVPVEVPKTGWTK